MAREDSLRHYTGILTEPMARSIALEDEIGRVPRWWSAQGLPDDLWPLFFISDLEQWTAQFAKRMTALCDHYEIDPASTNADLDLALALAQRHDRGSYRDGIVTFSRLRAKYGTLFDCTTASAAWELALGLAIKYVPGFDVQFAQLRRRSRLTIDGVNGRSRSLPMVLFFLIVDAVELHILMRNEPPPGAGKLSEILASDKEMRRISGPLAQLARGFHRAYGFQGKPVSQRTMESWIRWADDAPLAVREGRENKLEGQIIFEALDLYDDLARRQGRGGGS